LQQYSEETAKVMRMAKEKAAVPGIHRKKSAAQKIFLLAFHAKGQRSVSTCSTLSAPHIAPMDKAV